MRKTGTERLMDRALLAAAVSASLTILAHGGPGSTVLPLLKVGQGPRAAALGESYASISDDAGAIYWNPAGLGQLPRYHLSLSHNQWFSSITDEVFHAALPTGPGALGIGMVYSGEPGIESWSEENGASGTFATWDAILSLGYGFPVVRGWNLGISLQGLYEDLHTTFGYGGAVDVGILAHPTPFLGVGVVGRHLGLMYHGSDFEMLPSEVVAGVSYVSHGLNATLDFAVPFDNEVNVRCGVEYVPVREVAFRIGYRTGPADLTTLGGLSGLTAGLGFEFGGFGLDYAIAPYGKLGLTHRVGLRTEFARRGAGIVSIAVVDRTSMNPIQAGIALTGILDRSTTTNRAGTLKLSRLLKGRLVIRTARSGYRTRVDTLDVLGDREQFATIALDRASNGTIWGAIYDAATRNPIGGTISYSGPSYGEQTVASDPGTFSLRNLPTGTYELEALGPTDDYAPESGSLEVRAGEVGEYNFYLTRGRSATPVATPTEGFRDILFAAGAADVEPGQQALIIQAANLLRTHPSMVIELSGHTDSSEEMDARFASAWELSQARAEAVRKYLVDEAGIEVERVLARGYADTQPVAPGDTESGAARNRRAEFRVLEQ